MKGRGAPPANHRRYFWLPNPWQECNPLDRAQGPKPRRSERNAPPWPCWQTTRAVARQHLFVARPDMIRRVFDEPTLSAQDWEQKIETAIKMFLLLALLFLPVSLRCAFAGIHPVQLPKSADTPQCIECHEDKTKGKDVHPAVGMGCLTCHLIRNTPDTTRVNLRTARIATLCFQCHADKQPTAGNSRQIHAPAAQDCLKCHDPHTSANEHLLLKTASGGKADNLCLGCHEQGLKVPDKGSRHAALDMGCDSCHVTHKVGEIGKQEFEFHLTKAVPDLCVGCHDTKDPKLVATHQGQPFAGARCTSCHDPHDSKSSKLLQKYLHEPFADKSCDTCHQPAKDGKVVLTQASAKEICVTCHSDKAEQIEKAKVQHPGAAGECTDCHDPHAGRSPGFPKPNAVAVCLGCHSEQAEEGKKLHAHQPAFEQGCAICHDPHGNNNEHLLRVSKPNPLCLECHGPNANPKKLETEHLVTIFDGKVELPEDYFRKVPILPIEYGAGHPVTKHPVQDLVDPNDLTKVVTPLNCL